MKKSWVKKVLYVLAGIASVIIIFNAAKAGYDDYKTTHGTESGTESAQVQVVDQAA